MDRGEVAEGLQQIRQQPCFSDMRYVSLGLLDAAIALIEPQPVTEDALREAGFRHRRLRTAVRWELDFGGNGTLAVQLMGRLVEAVFWTEYGPVVFHITDMQHLQSVIAALRGREIEVKA